MTKVSRRHRRKGKPSKPGLITAAEKREARNAGDEVRREKLRMAGEALARGYAAGRDPDAIEIKFARHISEAVKAGDKTEQSMLRATRAVKKNIASVEKLRAKSTSPIGGESPSDDHLRKQAIVTPSIKDPKKPRHARLTGELPRAVQDMIRRGWLHAQEARALKLFADDFELGSAMGPSGPGPLRERVDGGLGPMGGTGRSGQSLEAWNRYLDAREVLGKRLGLAVEAVMVQGVTLTQAETPQTEKKQKAAAAAAFLMAAGELLVRHYQKTGTFES